MQTFDWSVFFSTWSWMVWFFFIVMVFSAAGNWGYTYTAHQKYNGLSSGKDAVDILSERYARGDITREEFLGAKDEIYAAIRAHRGLSTDTRKLQHT